MPLSKLSQFFFVSVLTLLTSSVLVADTLYEDAELNSAKWDVYDNTPINATVTQVFDTDKNSNVIEFLGDATANGYRLGHNNKNHPNAWADTTHKIISWESKFTESMVVYIPVETTDGFRYLYYTAVNKDNGIHTNPAYIHHGIGAKNKNGVWHKTNRDLESDLQGFEPNNQIISVNGFLIRGSGRVDNIATLQNLPPLPPVPDQVIYEDAENGNTAGWDVYDNTPEGATFTNITDADSNSKVIKLTGSATSNGYRLGHNSANHPDAWYNSTHKYISWDGKFSEPMVVYIPVQTTDGFRYLYYTARDNDLGIHSNPTYVHHGIGVDQKDGAWHTNVRDLQADLQEFEPNNQITIVNGILIRGSGRVDNIKTLKSRVIENTTPIANNQNVTVDEGSNIDITLIGSDADGDELTYIVVTQPNHGTLNASALPAITYIPNANYFGSDNFTFKVNDGKDDSNIATVIIDVVRLADTTPPMISLVGGDVSLEQGGAYIEQGASATDERDGTVNVAITGSVDIDVVGMYTLTYTATDAAGNTATKIRTVTITQLPDTTPPVVTLNGGDVTLEIGERYSELGATATDDQDGTIDVVISGRVDTSTANVYEVTYTATDLAGNSSSEIRMVTVILPPDTTPPVVTLNGGDVTLEIGERYSELGATATDDQDGTIDVVISGRVDTSTANVYEVTYTATDLAGNSSSVTRTVTVNDIVTDNYNVAISVATPLGDYLEGATIQIYKDSILVKQISDSSEKYNKVLLNEDTHYIITVDKQGYATFVTSIKTLLTAKILVVSATLVPHELTQIFDNNIAQNIVADSGAKVSFLASSFIDGDQNIAETVEVNITSVDFTQRGYLPAFPGRFLGYDDAGAIKPLVSYGVVDFSFESSDSTVKLLNGIEANIEIPLFVTHELNGVGIQVGESLPVWSLNELTGIWDFESYGEIVVSENSPTGMAVATTASHFTYFHTGAFEKEDDFFIKTVTVLESENEGDFGVGGGNQVIESVAQPNMPAYSLQGDRVEDLSVNSASARGLTTGNDYSTIRWLKRGPNCSFVVTTYYKNNIILSVTRGPLKCIKPSDNNDPVEIELEPDPVTTPEKPIIDVEPTIGESTWRISYPGKITDIKELAGSVVVTGSHLGKINHSGATEWISGIAQSNEIFPSQLHINQFIEGGGRDNPGVLKTIFYTFNDSGSLKKYDSNGVFISNESFENVEAGTFLNSGNLAVYTHKVDVDNNSTYDLALYGEDSSLLWNTDTTTGLFPPKLDAKNGYYLYKINRKPEINFIETYSLEGELLRGYYTENTPLVLSSNSFLLTRIFNGHVEIREVSYLGGIHWDKSLSLVDSHYKTAIKQNGMYYLLGTKEGSIIVSKIDADSGDHIWSRTYGEGSPSTIFINDVGNIYVGGDGFLFKIGIQPEEDIDRIEPKIVLLGEEIESILVGQEFIDKGAVAIDDVDGSISISIDGLVDTTLTGKYRLTYTAVDHAGNTSILYRTVYVLDVENQLPIANAGLDKTIHYNDPAVLDASESQDPDGSIIEYLWTEGAKFLGYSQMLPINYLSIGEHDIVLTVTDNHGGQSSDNVHVIVTLPLDITPPIITINGSDVSVEKGSVYADAGATAIDDRDGNVIVVTTGVVDTDTVGAYTITYTATDNAGNFSTENRLVTVTPVASELVVTSPVDGSTIPYNFITIQLDDSVTNTSARNLTIANSVLNIGIKNANSYLIYNVLLVQGDNFIEISAVNSSGFNINKIITINSEGKGIPPVYLKLERDKGYTSLTTQSQVIHGLLDVSKYFIDLDGDRIIDIESVTDTQELTFPAIGAYHTMATVKTMDNIFYSSLNRYNSTVNIIGNPELKSTIISNISAEVRDLEEQGNYVYTLMSNSIVKISKDNETQTEVISLSGFSNPQGFTLDSDSNIYIADTGSDRIVKLLASNSYQEDLSFNINVGGSENGQLMSPRDVTVMDSGSDLKIFVLDSGNNRIQVFDHTGIYLDQFDGSTTPQGKLNNPLNMIGAPRITITDSGNSTIREIFYNTKTKTETGTVRLALVNAGKVTDRQGGLLVPDKTSKYLLYLSNTGEIVDKLPLSQSVQIAISYEKTHQLLYAESGSSQLKHIYIPKTSNSASPTTLSEIFIQAYLANDDQAMRKLAPKSMIDELKAVDIKVREAFNNMSFYNESIYFHGQNAAVNGKATVAEGDVIIKFYYVWKNGRWLLKRVL